jgi:hypothetical protein
MHVTVSKDDLERSVPTVTHIVPVIPYLNVSLQNNKQVLRISTALVSRHVQNVLGQRLKEWGLVGLRRTTPSLCVVRKSPNKDRPSESVPSTSLFSVVTSRQQLSRFVETSAPRKHKTGSLQ